MKKYDDDLTDGQHVDTEELKGCLEEGFTPESTMHVYGISKKEYDRAINSPKNIHIKMSKTAPLYEADD